MPNKLNAFSLQPPASSLVPACWRTWVEIDRAALRHNIHVAKKRTPHADMIAVLKANAYGHGMEEVAKMLASHVSYFAVASCEEALRLQRVVPKVPIMLLSAALPCEYPIIAKKKMIPTISSFEEARAFATVAPAGAPIHVMIDTGMGRLGVAAAQAVQVVHKIAKLPLTIQSFSTHLPSADDDVRGTRMQLAAFKKIVSQLQAIVPDAKVHALNSAGVLHFSKEAHCTVRVGLMLYGVSPVPTFQKLLRPVMTWKARVTLIQKLSKGATISYGKTFIAPHDLAVAILPVGYADGYPRQLSNQGACVLINGRRCPVLGRVTMDQIVVDISRAGKVSVGDEVVLLGKQKDQKIGASWLASKAGTIPWHLFAGIGERVHRCYS
ncbi:MAG: alanine racemase [Chthoniobacterales bacterium]|nr:alanine racemase [Chthoniobacterales bacterium]